MSRWKKALVVLAVVEVGAALGIGRARAAGISFAATYDDSINNDPNVVAIKAAITAAMTQISNTFTATGTLNSSNPVAIQFQEETTGLGDSSFGYYELNYNSGATSGPNASNYRFALNAGKTSAFDVTALANTVPNQTNDPVTNTATINVNTALIRALGFSATTYSNGGLDGVISLNTSLMSSFNLQAVAEHEIDEVLGLGSGVDATSPQPTPQDLSRYSSNGTRSFTTSGDDAYFSINGTTDLVRFNQTAPYDYGDWWSASQPPAFPRVQDAVAYSGSQRNYGIEAIALDVIGYQLTSAANLNFDGVNFSGMSLAGPSQTNFTSSTFRNANLSNATLSNVNLTNATLSGAICANANFTAATINNANLTGANLTGAIFTGATYTGAVISAADLRGAVNFSAAGLTQTNAILPDGTWNNTTINGTNVVLGTSSIPVKGVGTPLSITSGSYFDIGNNSVILENGTALSTVQTDILSGSVSNRKIRSSAGLANTIGFVSGTEYLAAHGAGSSFAGVAVLSTYVLIMSTKPGDANLDGMISPDDYLLIDKAFAKGLSSPDWFNGNFDGSGGITAADYALIDASFLAQSGPSADGMIALHTEEFGQPYVDALDALGPDAVPEPASLGVLGIGALGLLLRRPWRFPSGAP